MSKFELVGKRNNHVFDIDALCDQRREGTIIMWYAKIPEVAWLQYLIVEDHKTINGESFRGSGIGTILVYKAMHDAHKLGFSDLLGELNAIPNGPEERRIATAFYKNLNIGLKDTKTLIARIPAVIARCEEIIERKNLQFTYSEK